MQAGKRSGTSFTLKITLLVPDFRQISSRRVSYFPAGGETALKLLTVANLRYQLS